MRHLSSTICSTDCSGWSAYFPYLPPVSFPTSSRVVSSSRLPWPPVALHTRAASTSPERGGCLVPTWMPRLCRVLWTMLFPATALPGTVEILFTTTAHTAALCPKCLWQFRGREGGGTQKARDQQMHRKILNGLSSACMGNGVLASALPVACCVKCRTLVAQGGRSSLMPDVYIGCLRGALGRDASHIAKECCRSQHSDRGDQKRERIDSSSKLTRTNTKPLRDRT